MYNPPFILAVLLFYIPSLLGLAVLKEKRDDDLPARVPYIFPEPGTDPVRSCLVNYKLCLQKGSFVIDSRRNSDSS